MGGDGLVFAREDGGYLGRDYVTKHVLYPALARAGIQRVGERGRKRDFHSFRHTFARLALEARRRDHLGADASSATRRSR